jgi:low temperature requirement protein LtrA
MSRRHLRDRTSHAEAKVTFAELFFDLVFVYAVTQLSHFLLEHHQSGWDLFEAALLLVAVWIVWVYTTWATNWMDPNHPLVRLMLFGLMGLGLVMSTTLPDAFGSRGLAFAVAYALLQNTRTAFTVWCLWSEDPRSRRSFLRIQFWLALAGVLWIAGGVADGHARLVWWSVALALEVGSPWWRFWTPGLGASTIADWQVSAHHFAERCGLFVIIALGESILVTGATFARLDWTPAVIAAFCVAFTGTVAMWWVYFATTADEAAEELAASAAPGELARAAYTYSHLPLVAGIIVTAVGDELVLAHPTGHASGATVAAVVGGAMLFLAGSALFNRMMCGEWPKSHLAGLALLVLCLPLGAVASPLLLSIAAYAALGAVGLWESKGRTAAVRSRP